MMHQSDEQLKKEIELLLSIYDVFIKTESKNGKTDFTTECENIFCPILNEIYKYELKNVNVKKHNIGVIDLIDNNKRVCVQVTSNSNINQKVEDTIQAFRKRNSNDQETKEKYRHLQNCDEIIIFYLTERKISSKIYQLLEQSESIITFDDLKEKIQECDKVQLTKIDNILKTEIGITQLIYEFEKMFNRQKPTYPKNYGKFLRWYLGSVDNTTTTEDIELTKEYFNKFAAKLAQLSLLTRMFINDAVKENIDNDLTEKKHRIYFNFNELKNHYHNKADIFDTTISSLIGEGIYEPQEWEDVGYNAFRIYSLNFCNSDIGSDTLYDLYKFCLSEKIDISKIIKDLNFTVLDD